jgi:tripartite-type tricarboxylate transporter receptor subunit TctC
MGGKVDAVAAGEAETRSGAKAGKLRVLAIFSSDKSQFFPDIPTAKSQGFDIDFGSWGGIYAPKGLPAPVAQKLESAIEKAVKDPAFADPMRNAGITVIYKDSKDFTDYVMAQHKAFESVLGNK